MKEHEWKVGDEAWWDDGKWKVAAVNDTMGTAHISKRGPRPFRETTWYTVALSLLKPVEKPELKTTDVVYDHRGDPFIVPTGQHPDGWKANRRITVNPNHPTVREMAESYASVHREEDHWRAVISGQPSPDGRVFQWSVVFPDTTYNDDSDQSFDAAMRWVKQQIDKETSDE